jgi:hypothetical protein
MEPNSTVDTILDWLKKQAESRAVIDPSMFVDAASKMVMLLGDEQDILYELQQAESQVMVSFIESGDSVAKAKLKVQALDIHRSVKKQEARIERCYELVRLAKIRSKIASDELRSYN